MGKSEVLCLLKTNAWLFSVISIVFVLIYIILFLSTGLDKIVIYNPVVRIFVMCSPFCWGIYFIGFINYFIDCWKKNTYCSLLYSVFLIFINSFYDFCISTTRNRDSTYYTIIF